MACRVGFSLLLLCLIGFCAAAELENTRLIQADVLRDHSGQCFDASRCALRDVGEAWTVHSACEKAMCVQSNGTVMEQRTSCRDVTPHLREGCYIVRVEGRPYPDCCPELFCDKEKEGLEPVKLPRRQS